GPTDQTQGTSSQPEYESGHGRNDTAIILTARVERSVGGDSVDGQQRPVQNDGFATSAIEVPCAAARLAGVAEPPDQSLSGVSGAGRPRHWVRLDEPTNHPDDAGPSRRAAALDATSPSHHGDG
uniref:hypothetical protein n=1 Tax=Streptomyces sp. NRRL S-813 TaxID=1463919 RepID=UPI00055AF9BA